MAATDLTGSLVGEWAVALKAPAQNRVRMWTVAHATCGVAVDLPQTLIQQALKGRTTLPPRAHCAGPHADADGVSGEWPIRKLPASVPA